MYIPWVSEFIIVTYIVSSVLIINKLVEFLNLFTTSDSDPSNPIGFAILIVLIIDIKNEL